MLPDASAVAALMSAMRGAVVATFPKNVDGPVEGLVHIELPRASRTPLGRQLVSKHCEAVRMAMRPAGLVSAGASEFDEGHRREMGAPYAADKALTPMSCHGCMRTLPFHRRRAANLIQSGRRVDPADPNSH